MKLLAVIGVCCCLGLTINTVIILALASFHKGIIYLNFNRYRELRAELVLGIVSLGLGVWGLVFLLQHV